MPFKIKDLMIHTVSGCGGVTQIPDRTGCRPATVLMCFTSNLTPILWTFPTTGTGIGIFNPVMQESRSESLAALQVLREQLSQELSRVDRQLRIEEEDLLPQTVEQVDDLSRKLTEALEALKQRRTELSEKTDSGGDVKPKGGP